MSVDDFKAGDVISFLFERDEIAGDEFIAVVAYTDDEYVYIDAGFESDNISVFTYLLPEKCTKLSEEEVFKRKLQGKGIGAKGYMKWANGS